MIRKSLKELSWDCEESVYRTDPALSYSRLAQFFRQGPKALISTEKIDTPALRFGSCVDTILTAPEEFEDKFYVADIDKFSDTFRVMTEAIYSNHPDLESISDVPNLLEYIGDWQPRWGEKAKIDAVVKGCSDYYTVLKYSKGMTVISPQEFQEAQQCVQTLFTHPFTYKIFECDEDEEIFYQLKFKENISSINVKMRCMFDILKVNHKQKTIRPIDLKTTGSSEEKFEKSFLDWCYWIQGSSYPTILSESLIKDDYFKDFSLLPFQFLVINKSNLTPLLWEMDLEETYEFTITNYGLNWVNLLQDADWHLQNGKFDYSRKSYENNGVNRIKLKI